MSNDRLLLVLPLPVYVVNGRFYTDSQACHGLSLWLANFNYVTLACPAETRATIPPATSAIDGIPGADRCTVVCLPRVFFPHHFAAVLPASVKLLKRHIAAADYLHFALGGLWGDWAAVGCVIAQMMGPSVCRLDRSCRATRCRIPEQVKDWNSSSLHPCKRSNYGEVSSDT